MKTETTYYVEAYNSSTGLASSRTPVTATINANPTLNKTSGSINTTQGTSNNITYSYSGGSAKIELNGSTVVTAPNGNGNISYNTSGLAVGTYNFKVTVTSTNCGSTSDSQTITVASSGGGGGNTPTLPNFPSGGQCKDDNWKFIGDWFYRDTWSDWKSFQFPNKCKGRLEFVFPTTATWYVEYELHDIMGGVTSHITQAYIGGGHQHITLLNPGMFVRFRLKYENGPANIQGNGSFQVQLNYTGVAP
jgi:hypothetical protein